MSENPHAAQPMRLELATVPVADIDRAKAFYLDQAGFVTELDAHVDDNHRFVALTSSRFGLLHRIHERYADPVPGSLVGIQRNVDDGDAGRADMPSHGVEGSATGLPVGGVLFFSDPDGNDWSVREPAG